MKKVFIQVPATSANCGPGFDTLGLACNLYNEVSYEITDRKGFQLEVEGEGADYLKPFGRNLAFASFLRVWNAVTGGQRIGLKVKMLNRIPMSRGLGSSSSAIVAGLFAANALCDDYYTKDELLGGGVIHCVLVRYSLWDSLTRKWRRQLAIGNNGDELQRLGRQQTQGMCLLLLHIADGKAAVQRRCQK